MLMTLRRHVLTAAMLLIMGSLAGPAIAQESGRRLAFFVGVSEYDHADLKSLPYTDRDVEDSAQWLGRVGYEVRVLSARRGKTDKRLLPTAANIRDRLAEFLAKPRAVTKNDLIIIGLSGHGLQPRGSADSFFCPADANPTFKVTADGLKQEAKFPKSLVGIPELLETLRESGIGPKLLLVDACRVEPSSKGARRGIDEIESAQLPPRTAVLLSCSRGQFSFEDEAFDGGHGAFFLSVIDGLKGGAIDGKRSRITWQHLATYVCDEVPDRIEAVAHLKKDGAVQQPHIIANIGQEQPVLLTSVDVAKLKIGVASPLNPQPERAPSKPSPATVGDAKRTKAGEERDDNSLQLKLVWCPPGEFMMGSPASEKDRDKDEDQVNVKLTNGFWLGKYEVTQGEWERAMGTTPWKEDGKTKGYVKEGAKYPATYVSWDDAVAFCEKLTRQERAAGRLPEGSKYTLPTEAQWEYACRGGTTTRFSFGDDESKLRNHAWWGGVIGEGNAKDEQYAHEVGRKQANAFGLHDMHGNVWEWCQDVKLDQLPGGSDPQVSSGGSFRVNRGGGWSNDAADCRSADRSWDSPSNRDYYLGFRVARSSGQ